MIGYYATSNFPIRNPTSDALYETQLVVRSTGTGLTSNVLIGVFVSTKPNGSGRQDTNGKNYIVIY